MKKLLEKAKKKLTGKKTDKRELEFEKQRKEADEVVKKLWPSGTWTLPVPNNSPRTDNDAFKGWPVMDFVVLCVLEDVWWLEAFVKAEEMAGRKLNPGMFGDRPDPMPKDWKPSKKIIEHFATRSEVKVDPECLKHIIEKLTALKNIKP